MKKITPIVSFILLLSILFSGLDGYFHSEKRKVIDSKSRELAFEYASRSHHGDAIPSDPSISLSILSKIHFTDFLIKVIPDLLSEIDSENSSVAIFVSRQNTSLIFSSNDLFTLFVRLQI